MVEAAQTVGELLAAASADLAGAGLAEPRREAIRLWSDLLGGATTVMMDAGQVADARAATRYADAIRRRIAGEPLAYITGWTGFRRLIIACDRRALIPRPETEGLVDAALARVARGVAVDIGTGTGAIALALRDEGGFHEVIGTDLSPDALALARHNGTATGRRVSWQAGDLLAPLGGRLVDLLVSNPPYLTVAEHDSLDRSVRDYEPAAALLGGVDGLDLVRRLLGEAPAVVRPGGWIALEIDCRRADDAGRLALAAGWNEVLVLDDLFGRARYLLARRGSER